MIFVLVCLKHALGFTMLDVVLLHSPDVALEALRDTMVTLLSKVYPQPPPPQPSTPVCQPNIQGIIYDGHEHGQPWQYHNAITSASRPADRVDGVAAAVDTDAEGISPTDDVDTAEELEVLLNQAARDPEVASMLESMAVMPQQPSELVVGEDEDDDLEEAGRASSTSYCLNPHESVADAISDAFFEGLTWDAVRGERPKIALRPTTYPHEKSGKPSRSCRMWSM